MHQDWVVVGLDNGEAAAGFLREGLTLNRDVGNWEWVAYSLENFAALAGAKTQGERAAKLWGAAEALREEIGSPLQPTDQADYDHNVVAARTHLDGAAWEAAWEQGRAISFEEAIEYALFGEEPTHPEPSAPEEQAIGTQPAALTRREQEVANLIGRRLTRSKEDHKRGPSVGHRSPRLLISTSPPLIQKIVVIVEISSEDT